MAHYVTRRGYHSLEESYRDANGKPRKRVLDYYGKSDPRREQMLATVERKAEELDAAQRAEFGETGAERRERIERGLPAPVVATEPVHSPDAQPQQSDSTDNTHTADDASEPSASDDASGDGSYSVG